MQLLMPFLCTSRAINWRLILIHFIAIWILQQAALQFAYLPEVELLEWDLYPGRTGNVLTLEEQYSRRLNFLKWVGISAAGGLLAGFILSLLLCKMRKWYWVNALLSIIALVAVIKVLNYYEVTIPKNLFWLPGKFFHSLFLHFLIDGLILLVISLVLFFFKPVHRFIKGPESTSLSPTFEFEAEPEKIE